MRKMVIAIAVIGFLIVIGFLYLQSFIAPYVANYPQVHIRSDGTIEGPSSELISRKGNLYTLKANITLYKLFIEKSNMIFDCNGFKIKIVSPNGSRGGPGLGSLELTNVENVTLRNIITGYPKITANNFYENYTAAILIFKNSSFCESANSKVRSIAINNSSDIQVSGHNGRVTLTNSRNCNISSCTNFVVTLYNSHENMILNNDMTETKRLAFRLEDSNSNLFFGNRIERTMELFEITGSSANNLFVGNYIRGAFNSDPTLDCSGINTFYHNNFVYVYWNRTATNDTFNLWDNGSEGNYWNDYQGEDFNGDGIGDIPHIVDNYNIDRYPLMNPLDLSSEPLPKLPE